MNSLRNLRMVGGRSQITMLCRRGILLALFATLAFPAAADEPKAEEAKPEKKSPPVTLDEGDADFSNWVNLSLGGASVDGNNAAFQQRVGLPANSVFGGVSDLHLEHSLTNKWLLKLDGHGLFDYHDYGFKFDLTREDRGFLRAGYSESRTYYNGSGGYLPGADLWLPLSDSELFVDRGSAWVEGGLTLPGWPALRVKYTHDFRDGQKDSTIWGQVNTPYGVRGINSSFYNLDEKRDTIEGEITHTIGKTDLGLKVTYEMADRNNSLNLQQFPGTPNSYVTQKEGIESDLFNVHGWSSTWFDKKTVLSLGYGYTHLDTDLTGSRIYGDQFESQVGLADFVADPALDGVAFLVEIVERRADAARAVRSIHPTPDGRIFLALAEVVGVFQAQLGPTRKRQSTFHPGCAAVQMQFAVGQWQPQIRPRQVAATAIIERPGFLVARS